MNHIPFSTAKCSGLLVKVPKGAKDIWVGDHTLFYMNRSLIDCYMDIPHGKWQFLCIGSEATEEMAMQIVGQINIPNSETVAYIDYDAGTMGKDEVEYYALAQASLHSLIRANGFEPETCAVLIKQS